MKNIKMILFMIISVVCFSCFNSDVYAAEDTKCVYDFITFTITPDGIGNAKLETPSLSKTSYQIKNNYVYITNFVKDSVVKCPSNLYYKTESGGYGAANSGKTFYTISFNRSDILSGGASSLELTDSVNDNNDISVSGGGTSEDYEYVCSYTGQLNGKSLIIKKYSVLWNITYPDGSNKEIAKNSVGGNVLPSSSCEDVFYSSSSNVLKSVEHNSMYTGNYLSQYCSSYNDLEQFCENGTCKINNVQCGSNSGTDQYGDCPEELAPIILFLKKVVINTLNIFVPIILIIIATIDFIKAVMAPDEKTMQEAIPKVIRRVLAAVLMVFVTTIVVIVLDMFATSGVGEYNEWKSCWLGFN